jgi:hypothetical protein
MCLAAADICACCKYAVLLTGCCKACHESVSEHARNCCAARQATYENQSLQSHDNIANANLAPPRWLLCAMPYSRMPRLPNNDKCCITDFAVRQMPPKGYQRPHNTPLTLAAAVGTETSLQNCPLLPTLPFRLLTLSLLLL